MIEGEPRESGADIGAAQHGRHLLAGEKPGQELGDEFRGARRELRGLQHDAVARGERGDQRHHRQLEGIIPRADDADDAERLAENPRATRPELETDRDALRPHPAREMARGVADAGERREDLREQALMARAVAEIGGDRCRDLIGVLPDRRLEAGEIGAALGQRRRAGGKKRLALALQRDPHLVDGARRCRPQHGRTDDAHDDTSLGGISRG